ncbi:hypothetical protein OYT88_11975 [Sporolactobacillus sp. CQH2019]|uniref:hypothetical protein n=1 Tax=Sporolactobacillus sp. CQH2019 TaxID=3023512 RepID=UPI0023678FC5|nr:hypothetical protein [Sporolactobacillus sp. CQH2019]MDD9149272.1 hypothetical protein [Sporolactobacillus sp. CQH2019]
MSELAVRIYSTPIPLNHKSAAIPRDEEVDVSKEISDMLTQASKQQHVLDQYKSIKCEAVLYRDIVKIKKVYLYPNNGNVRIINGSYKLEIVKHNIFKNAYKKVGGLLMSFHLPISLHLYAVEISGSIKDGFAIKALFASLMSAVLTFFHVSVSQLVGGFVLLFVLALLDLILGLIPGNIKEGTEKEHALQSRALTFTTNIIAIVAGLIAHVALMFLVGENSSWITQIGINVHYFIISWIILIYVYRIIGYIANSNHVRVPKIVKNFVKK